MRITYNGCWRVALLILVFTFTSLNLVSQNRFLSSQGSSEYGIEYIDISSGLSNNYVSKIIEDNFGMLWIACEGGVNRFDGDEFKLLRPNKRYEGHLLNENIETLFVDSKDHIWVGTKSGGISKYSQAEDQFINYNEIIRQGRDIPAIRITDIAEDAQGNIWIATWKLGLYKLSGSSYELLGSYYNDKTIHSLEVDINGHVWATSNNMLLEYNPSKNTMSNLSLPIGVSGALHFDIVSNKLLIGSFLGLFSFDIDNHTLKEFEQSVLLNFVGINSLNVDKRGRIWVGSWSQGLHLSSPDRTKFNKISLTPFGQKNTNYETVLDIMINKNDEVWIGTGYGGIVKLNPSKSIIYIANTFDSNTNLPDNNIQAIVKDTNGILWCGTWGGGVGFSKDFKNFELLPGTVSDNKISVFLQIDQTMLVGTSHGLLFYDINNLKEGPFKTAFPLRRIRDILLDSKQRLWIGTQQNGLLLFDFDKDKNLEAGVSFESNTSIDGALKSDRISKLIEDQEGNIWVGTYNGLYLFNSADSTFIRKDNPNSGEYPSVIVLSLLAVDSSELWIGMPGGLLKTSFENQNLQVLDVFNRSDGLKNDYITGITLDNQKNIWLSNTSGIATIRGDNSAVINVAGNVEYAYAMNINAYFNDNDQIYFGSSNGLFYFDPLQINLTNKSQTLIFNTLKIDNKEVNVDEQINGRVVLEKAMPFTDKIELTYKESIVSVGFVPGNSQDRNNLSYHYRVLGLQNNWIDNGADSEINFIGLDAGNYTLEVRSTNDRVNFSEVTRLEIAVLPPPWLSKWAYMIYVILLMVIAFAINRFFVNRAKLRGKLAMAKLTTEKDHELNEAKLRFFTNISHELRTPLTLILSPISEILSNPKLKIGLKERLTYVENNANQLLRLINQLIDFRKVDQGELKLKVATGNFVKFANEIFLSFKGFAETEGVNYSFSSTADNIELTYDRDKMEIVICNLLSNAFKFTPRGGEVILSINEQQDFCNLTIRDTGKGISKTAQEKIFDRFYQIQDSESASVIGSGIGLSLSQNIVQLHSGNIEVQSSLGNGSSFTAKIPKGSHHFDESYFVNDFQSSEDITIYREIEDESVLGKNGVNAEEDQVTVLIVDDNQDILSYLKTLFEETGYLVVTASNGKQAMDLAFEISPEIIISDVMMPEMDGIELCGHLKNDIRTSHIPIILLTARTSTVYEVNGLETGADDYVRKPFNSNVIKSRVAAQLENRQKVRSYIMNQVRLEPTKGLKPINKEEKFIYDLSEIIKNSLDDESFNIDSLADDFCMSQSTLYRKIKSLTGMSIVGFIRSIRLRKATEILVTEDLKLSAVAHSVGFNDYKYFKKSFTKQYGVSPKEYRDNALNQT